MAKEKLFTPEDFDKPDSRNNGKWLKIVLIIIVCVAIICGLIWAVRTCSSENEGNVPEPKDSTMTVKTEDPQIQQRVSGDDAQIGDEKIGKSEITEDVVPTSVEDNQATSNISKEVKHNVTITDDIDTEALNVIRGDYGNVPERKQLLGDKFQSIQNRVNQLKKEGVF